MIGRPQIESAVQRIVRVREESPAKHSVLVGVSGIDGCGKGYLSAKMVEALADAGLRVAALSVDGWLNLPHLRFSTIRPAQHFYDHAIRFDEMFKRLVLPLRDHGSVRVEIDFTEETASVSRTHVYELTDVEVIVLEGIYLLKRALRHHYDLSFWIECTFETALERAIARSQERLSADDTIQAYRTIYFPAQEIHFARDDPKTAATGIIDNDPRLSSPTSG